MTSSLVRKGLELFSDGLHANETNPKDKNRLKTKPEVKNKRTKKRKNQHQTKKKVKSAIETYVQKQPEDQTENNLAYFLSTSQYAPNYDKIMVHLKGRMAKNQHEEVEEEEFAGFTEDDFAKFEKEYR